MNKLWPLHTNYNIYLDIISSEMFIYLYGFSLRDVARGLLVAISPNEPIWVWISRF